jgi:thiamine biosynthesis protein ThiS
MIKIKEKSIQWREGMTVADLLKDLDDPQHYAVVKINDKYISRPDFKKTMIPDNSEIFLIPMIAGG